MTCTFDEAAIGYPVHLYQIPLYPQQDIVLNRPLKVDSRNSNEIAGTSLAFRETKTVQHHSEDTPCKNYQTNSGFLDCAQAFIQ